MFNGQDVANWLKDNVVVVIMIVIAIGVLVKAQTGEARKAIGAVGITLLALFLIGAAPNAGAIGTWLYNLVS